jgi:hypothetical protein
MILLDPGGSMVLKPATDARSTVLASLALEILCFPTGFPRTELRDIFPLGEHSYNTEVSNDQPSESSSITGDLAYPGSALKWPDLDEQSASCRRV